MLWELSNRTDPEVRPLADRHYNRQHIGAANFAPPGRCLVLKTLNLDAFWITSFPFAEYVKHDWAGAFICSAFRNEGSTLSSLLVMDAVKATRWLWPKIPDIGMVTFVNPKFVRKKRDYGRCYLKAGFKNVGKTKGGLIALQLLPEHFPEQQAPVLNKYFTDKMKQQIIHNNSYTDLLIG